MGGGIYFKRKERGGSGAETESGTALLSAEAMRTSLGSFVSAVDELGAKVADMDCETIHTRLTPLFVSYGQPFVESRESLRAAYGGSGFVWRGPDQKILDQPVPGDSIKTSERTRDRFGLCRELLRQRIVFL